MSVLQDNLPKAVADSLAYLKTGGLGEVIGFTDIALRNGQPKVQSDTDMAMALCLLASAGLHGSELIAGIVHARAAIEDAADVVAGTMGHEPGDVAALIVAKRNLTALLVKVGAEPGGTP